MFEDPAAWCADRAPGQQFPADALPLDVRQLQNSALPIQVTNPKICNACLHLLACYIQGAFCTRSVGPSVV